MYLRLLTNLCERSLYRASSNVGLRINRLCHAANKNEEKQKMEIVSTRFPDYKAIYIFPYIRYISVINRVKFQMTVIAAMAVPVIAGLYLTNIMSLDMAISSIASGILSTIWIHSLGIFCNNLIGYVYIKLDKRKVILSYVDYWGKRIDMEITIDEIIPMSDNAIGITDYLYKKILFTSQKQKLKINTKLGRIIDTDKFKYILGTD